MRPASRKSTEDTATPVAGLSRVNANFLIGRRDDKRAAAREDIRSAKYHVGDVIQKHKRVNPSS